MAGVRQSPTQIQVVTSVFALDLFTSHFKSAASSGFTAAVIYRCNRL
jgi:hypothetical protein